jgi:hypothetical protein
VPFDGRPSDLPAKPPPRKLGDPVTLEHLFEEVRYARGLQEWAIYRERRQAEKLVQLEGDIAAVRDEQAKIGRRATRLERKLSAVSLALEPDPEPEPERMNGAGGMDT